HGSLFEEHRNRSLTANSFFNNTRGQRRDLLIRNFFGGRAGGPIRKNKTFFHFFYEKRYERASATVTSTVFTQPARQGVWRFYPGVRNGNALSAVPTVDLQGNPVRPAAATGDLQSVSVFGRDPNRLGPDTSGIIAKQLELMPLPNDFRGGDGLNTGSYIWNRPRPYDFNQFDIKVDNQFTARNRASFTYSEQGSQSKNYIAAQAYPSTVGGGTPNETTTMTLSVTSTLRSSLLNEFRSSSVRPRQTFNSPWTVAGPEILPNLGGQPFLLSIAGATSPLFPGVGDDPSTRISPVYQFSNTMTWLKGRHAFRGGLEVRFVSSAGFDTFFVMPRITLGAAGVPVQNVNATTIPGLGQNTGASALLTDLAGSVSFAQQTFNSPGGANPAFLPGQTRYQHVRAPEYSGFFKDDYKVRPNLTLNLGVRYELYQVPTENTGRGAALAGGSGSIFGISGTSFADMFQPGRTNGQPSRIVPLGPRTTNPEGRYYAGDHNNFAPAVGLSWNLPWFGLNKTVFRMGYGIGFERNPIYFISNTNGPEPGFSTMVTAIPITRSDLSNFRLPLRPEIQPLAQVPFTDRNSALHAIDDHLRTGYYQNFNVSLQRSLSHNTFFEARYVGNKGSKLPQRANINEVNIFENGILDAFRITQAGGNSPLLDRIFTGLGGVDGRTVTGSDLVRSNNAGMQGFLVNNDVVGFANFLNNTPNFGGGNGGLLRRVGLPENFVAANPQFGTANLASNYGGSSYHSMQLEVVKRFASGWLFQGNYTWSKALGNYDGEGSDLTASFRTLRNRNLDKTILSFNRARVWRSNGIWELPFGPGKAFGRNSRGLLAKLIGGWQTGSIFTLQSGAPITLTASGNTFSNGSGSNTPVPVADFPKDFGQAERVGDGVIYFRGLSQVVDPYVKNITAVNGIQQRSTMLAVTDASGKLLMVNAAPGQMGTLAVRFLEGPGSFRLDVNLLKRIKIGERWQFDLRADAVNATNTPQFGNPSTGINSLNLGRITGAGGNRVVVISARLDF
ncbi:MAG: hypothetical protein ACRD8O_09595, partial [Bryobacteraceae bacterium]